MITIRKGCKFNIMVTGLPPFKIVGVLTHTTTIGIGYLKEVVISKNKNGAR